VCVECGNMSDQIRAGEPDPISSVNCTPRRIGRLEQLGRVVDQMVTRRQLLLFSLPVLSLVLLGASWWLVWPVISPRNAARIRQGMTTAEVEKVILDQPLLITIIFTDNGHDAIKTKFWDDGSIVDFDNVGVVLSVRTEPLLDRIRRWTSRNDPVIWPPMLQPMTQPKR
jgi:hypothetical protein